MVHNRARCSGIAAICLVAMSVLPAVAAAPKCKKGEVRDAAGACASPCAAGMAYVPGGTFTMGDPKADDDRGPAHKVTLSPYCVDVLEVRTLDYLACVAAGGCSATEASMGCNAERPEFADHPINCVSWEQAGAFCKHAGKRLPTEAEWEFAARGTDGRRYPWGNARPDLKRAHWSTRGQYYVNTVVGGSKKAGASPYGVMDMAGNVCELVADVWALRYPSGDVTDPLVMGPGGRHVCRGGSLNNRDGDAISSTFRRHGYSDGSTDELTGFRCAAAPSAHAD